jgi:hypothetical protein
MIWITIINLLAVGTLITSCGSVEKKDDETQSQQDTSLSLVPSEDQLPECKDGLLGKVFFIQDTELFKVCTSSGWTVVDLSGPEGNGGNDGKDGSDGSNGFNSLIKTTDESPGSNCIAGGKKIESGLDNGEGNSSSNDGILSSDEVDVTEYICEDLGYPKLYDASGNLVGSIIDSYGDAIKLVKDPTQNEFSWYTLYSGSGATFSALDPAYRLSIASIFMYSSSDCSGTPHIGNPPTYYWESREVWGEIYAAGFIGNGSHGDSSSLEITLSSNSPNNFIHNSYAKCESGSTCTSVSDLTCTADTDASSADWYPVTISETPTFTPKLNSDWYIEP